MELMIVHPLVLPDTALDLAALEEAVGAWGREVQRQALALGWQRQAALRPPVPCPQCAASDLSPAGSKPRKIETTFGPVWHASSEDGVHMPVGSVTDRRSGPGPPALARRAVAVAPGRRPDGLDGRPPGCMLGPPRTR